MLTTHPLQVFIRQISSLSKVWLKCHLPGPSPSSSPLGKINCPQPSLASWLRTHFSYSGLFHSKLRSPPRSGFWWAFWNGGWWCCSQAWATLKRAVNTNFTPKGAEPGQRCFSEDICFPCLLPSLKFSVSLTSLVLGLRNVHYSGKLIHTQVLKVEGWSPCWQIWILWKIRIESSAPPFFLFWYHVIITVWGALVFSVVILQEMLKGQIILTSDLKRLVGTIDIQTNHYNLVW